MWWRKCIKIGIGESRWLIYGCSLYNSFNISACLKIFIIRYDKASIFLRVHQSELEAKDSFKKLSKFICWLQFLSSYVSSSYKEIISIHEVSLCWSLSDSCKLHAYVWILIKVSFFLQTVRAIKHLIFLIIISLYCPVWKLTQCVKKNKLLLKWMHEEIQFVSSSCIINEWSISDIVLKLKNHLNVMIRRYFLNEWINGWKIWRCCSSCCLWLENLHLIHSCNTLFRKRLNGDRDIALLSILCCICYYFYQI